jgi:hypothetical protein
MAMTQRRVPVSQAVAAKERGEKKSESPSGAGVFDCAARKAGRGGAGDPPAANIF